MIGYILLAILYSFHDMVLRSSPKIVTSVVAADGSGAKYGTGSFNLGFSFVWGTSGEFIDDPSYFSITAK